MVVGAPILPVVTTPTPSRMSASYPWWNRILWLWSGSFAAFGTFLLLVAHRPTIGWTFLLGAAVPLVLLLLGINSGKKDNKWVRANYPDATVWAHVRVQAPAAVHLRLPTTGKRKQASVFLVVRPAGIRMFTGNRRDLAVAFPWRTVEAARAARSAKGLARVDVLTLRLSGGRRVEMRSYDVSSRWATRFIHSRPADIPWPSAEVAPAP